MHIVKLGRNARRKAVCGYLVEASRKMAKAIQSPWEGREAKGWEQCREVQGAEGPAKLDRGWSPPQLVQSLPSITKASTSSTINLR